MNPVLFVVAVFLLDTPGAIQKDIAECPRQEKQFNLNIQHKVVDITDLRKDAEVRFGRADELMQIRAGAGGRAKHARVVMRGVRGQVHLRWRGPKCGNLPCAISSVIDASRPDAKSASPVESDNAIVPCTPDS
jgi:hypothetical protein